MFLLLDRQINRLKKYFEEQMEAILEEKRKIQREIELERRQQENERIEKLLREMKQMEDLLEVKERLIVMLNSKGNNNKMSTMKSYCEKRNNKMLHELKLLKNRLVMGLNLRTSLSRLY